MGKQSSSAKPQTGRKLRRKAKTPKVVSKNTTKSATPAPSQVPGKAPSNKKKKKIAKPLPEWSDHEDEEFQGLLNNMLTQRKQQAGPPTTPAKPKAAHREAVRTRQASCHVNDEDAVDGEGDEDEDQHASEVNDDEDDDEEAIDDSEGSAEEEEGSGAEGSDEAESTDAATESRTKLVSSFQHAMKETDPDLDEEEEIEMRTIKGKGKAKISGSIKFAGLIMLRRRCHQDGSIPKPTAEEIERLEKCGLAITRTKEPWLELPSNATHGELDQIFGEMLPEPFEHLRREAEDDMPVWELLIPRNRTLHRRTEDTPPEAADVQRSWTLGRAIRDKKVYIAPAISFSKDVLTAWGLNASGVNAPTSARQLGPSSSRKRRIDSTDSEKENNEVAIVDETEGRRKRPRLNGSRSTAGKPREEIDLTMDEVAEISTTPLREKQPPRIFVHKSPSKEFNPYLDPGCYFK